MLINKVDFDKLSVNEQRMAICRDVIMRLHTSKIVPNQGLFFGNRWEVTRDATLSVQEAINANSCAVCAKGALFCSWVGNFNNVDRLEFKSVSESTTTLNSIVPELIAIFGRQMVDDIEAAFEGEVYSWHYDDEACQHYADAFGDYDLKDIMQYIVDNGGEFPLPADYEAE
jgi:hypothetical protein